jgi:hypothetical protein
MKLAGQRFLQLSRRFAWGGIAVVICLTEPVIAEEWSHTLPEAYFPSLRQALESAATLSPTMLERTIEVSLQQARLPASGCGAVSAVGRHL